MKEKNRHMAWTWEDDFKLRELHKEGKSDSEIGRILGRSKGAVYSRRRTLGLIKRRVVKLTEEDLDEIEQRRANGETYTSIAKDYGVYASSIGSRVRELHKRRNGIKEIKLSDIYKFRLKPGKNYLIKGIPNIYGEHGTHHIDKTFKTKVIKNYKHHIHFKINSFNMCINKVDFLNGDIAFKEI